MFETVATGAKQEWVRSFGTVGVRERTKNSGSMILHVASCVAAGMGGNPAKFEDTWKAREHQVEVCDNFVASKLDDDVEISVVPREAR